VVRVTLRCECGGPVELQNGTDHGDGNFFETYECTSCGRTGGYSHDRVTGDSLTGCLTNSGGFQ